MLVNMQNNYAQSFGALVPLSKYKGPLLDLTAHDKEQIANIQKQITALECNVYEYSTLHKSKKRTSDVQERVYNGYCNYVANEIEALRKKIVEIKKHRLKIQNAIKSGKNLKFEQLV